MTIFWGEELSLGLVTKKILVKEVGDPKGIANFIPYTSGRQVNYFEDM
jgi:hypothetical protein